MVTDNAGATAQSELSVLLKPNNQLPVITVMQSNQNIEQAGEQVALEITATDDSQVSQIEWTQTSGTAVTIENAGSQQASFIAPAYSESTYDNALTFLVTVTDDDGDSAQQTVMVNILGENILPTVEVIGPGAVSALDEVVVTVNAADSDGDIVDYLWTLTSYGVQMDFNQDDSGTLSFVAQSTAVDKVFDFQVTVTDNRDGQASADYRVTIKPVPPQIDEFSISATTVNSGDLVQIDWQVTYQVELRDFQLRRSDTGEEIPLTRMTDNSATFVTPFVQEQTEQIDFEFTIGDIYELTDSESFSLTLTPFTGVFAPSRMIYDIPYSCDQPFYGFEKMNAFGSNLVVKDREMIPELHLLKFENGNLVVDESFDSRPWTDHSLPIHDWLNADINQDGIDDVVVIATAGVYTTNHLIGIMLGDNDGNLSSIIPAGEYDPQMYSFLNGFDDVNGDGYKDLRMVNAFSVNKEFFLAYQVETQSFEFIEDSAAIEPDGTQNDQLNFKVFADVNGNGKNELVGLEDTQEPCVNLLLCGKLSLSMIDDQGQYQSMTSFESRYLSGNSLRAIDVDLDGKDDLVFDGYEQPLPDSGGLVAAKHWYRYEQDNSVTTISLSHVPEYYLDLFGTGQPYFFDLNTDGQLTTYKYDELSQTLIVDTIHKITSGQKGNLTFMDLDKDGDLDMVFSDNEVRQNSISWIENLYQ